MRNSVILRPFIAALPRLNCAKVLLIVVAMPTAVIAQQPPTIRLDKPEAAHPAEWIDVVAVRELKDGRLIVLDARDQAVKLVDMRAGTAVMIGRKGNGPGEYQLPLDLFALPGDSSAIFDMANSGAPMVITPFGKAGGVLPGLGAPRAANFVNIGSRVDALGRVYRGASEANSEWLHAIERLDRASGRIDTVAFYSRKLISPLIDPKPPAARAASSRAVAPTPFASRWEWDVSPDGSVVLVSPEPYRVTRIDARGSRLEGPLIPYVRIRLTAADKAEWRAQRERPSATVMYGAGARTYGYQKMRSPFGEPDRWPEFLPVYATGRMVVNRVNYAPDRMLWIERATTADTPALYDVIGPSGKLAYRVTLPVRTRIVGFGANGIYAIQLDDDDIQHLQRFRFPSVANR